MTIYKKITKKNSEQYFEDFIEKKEITLNWLSSFIESKGGEKSKLDFSPNSLIYLWDRVSKHIKRVNPIPNYEKYQKSLPLWFYLHSSHIYNDKVGGYTLESLKIMEALIYYFGEIFIQGHKLEWSIWYEEKPKMIYKFLPIISISSQSEIYPFLQIASCSVIANNKLPKLSKTTLYDIYNSWKENIKK